MEWTVAELKAQVYLLSAEVDALRKQMGCTVRALADLTQHVPSQQHICVGRQNIDWNTFRKQGYHPKVTPHVPHMVDQDPDGLFEAYSMHPRAPIELLWDQMNLRGFTETQKGLFVFVRDHPQFYHRFS